VELKNKENEEIKAAQAKAKTNSKPASKPSTRSFSRGGRSYR